MENKYLEKIAGFAAPLIQGFKGLGKNFQGLDAAYGSTARTVEKAFKPMQTFNAGAAARSEIKSQLRSVNNKNISDAQIRSALSGMSKKTKIQFNGKTLNSRNISSLTPQELRRAHTRANIMQLRQNAGLVREQGTQGIARQSGLIQSVNRGNYIGTPNPRFDASKLLAKTNAQSATMDLSNQRIRNARFKVGMGVGGLAGTAALGYHAANRNNDPGYNQQQFYMP
jgi:Tfp pilus assembly protein PilP